MKEVLLRLLNKMERTPSFYARIDNIRNYSRQFLNGINPSMTMGEFLDDMDRMESCMNSGENCVITEHGINYVNDLSPALNTKDADTNE